MKSANQDMRVLCLHVVLLLTCTLKGCLVTGQATARAVSSSDTSSFPIGNAIAKDAGSVSVPVAVAQLDTSIVAGCATSGGGVPAADGSFGYPYTVSLRRRSDLGYFCTGVLVGNAHVLTAAHCVDSSITSADSQPEVVAGSASSSKTSGPGLQVISTQNVIIHPGYRGGRENDLAILELSSAANQSPVRLPINTRFHPQNVDSLLSVGWGRQGQDAGIPETAQVVSMRFVNRRACRVKLRRQVRNSEICMGGQGTGSCPGDDGGPIILPGDTRCDDILVGIVGSFHVCGGSSKPDVHTRTAPFIDWIKSTAGVP